MDTSIMLLSGLLAGSWFTVGLIEVHLDLNFWRTRFSDYHWKMNLEERLSIIVCGPLALATGMAWRSRMTKRYAERGAYQDREYW